MSENSRFDVIFFDIGGVLLDLHFNRMLDHLSRYSQLNKDRIQQHFPLEIHHRYEKGMLSDSDYFQQVKSALPQPNALTETAFWRGWELLIGGEKATVKIFDRLRASYPVWLLSNTNPYHIQYLAPRYAFYHAAHGHIFSYEVGSRKPEADIFQTALKQTKVETPPRALFIDDMEENVEKATDLGIHALHFTQPEILFDQLKELGLPVD